MKAYVLPVFILIGVATSAWADTSNDLDNDGVSDFSTADTSGSALAWTTRLSSDSSTVVKSCGSPGDKPALAPWFSAGTPSLGVVQVSTDGKSLVWKTLQSNELIAQISFGKPGDVYLSGGDYDGDGIADGATVRYRGKSLVWRVLLGMFTDTAEQKGPFAFGKVGDRVFFFNPDGTQDWLGVFGLNKKKKKCRLLLRNLNTGAQRKVPGFQRRLCTGERPRPFPIRTAEGEDLLAFAVTDRSDTQIKVYSLSDVENTIAEPTFPGLGTVVVGDYTNSPGEEVGFQNSNDLKIYNPEDNSLQTRTKIAGTLIDEINVDGT